MKEHKLKQIRLSVDDKHLKIIGEAFKSNDIKISSIDKRFPADNYFYVIIDEFAIPDYNYTKIKEYLKKNSDSLMINWIGLKENPTPDQTHLLEICIKA